MANELDYGTGIALIKALGGSGGGGGGGDISDVRVNGTSVVSDGVANVPVADNSTLGVVKVNQYGGLQITTNGDIGINSASDSFVKGGSVNNYPLTPGKQHLSTFYGLSKAAGVDLANETVTVGTYTEAAKSAISQMLNGSVSVTGSTPSITALPGIRYICGECATLDITLPASGCFDVVFESGSTPTVLTAAGVTWPGWFDLTALEANTTYEISIADGFGAVMTWA